MGAASLGGKPKTDSVSITLLLLDGRGADYEICFVFDLMLAGKVSCHAGHTSVSSIILLRATQYQAQAFHVGVCRCLCFQRRGLIEESHFSGKGNFCDTLLQKSLESEDLGLFGAAAVKTLDNTNQVHFWAWQCLSLVRFEFSLLITGHVSHAMKGHSCVVRF